MVCGLHFWPPAPLIIIFVLHHERGSITFAQRVGTLFATQALSYAAVFTNGPIALLPSYLFFTFSGEALRLRKEWELSSPRKLCRTIPLSPLLLLCASLSSRPFTISPRSPVLESRRRGPFHLGTSSWIVHQLCRSPLRLHCRSLLTEGYLRADLSHRIPSSFRLPPSLPRAATCSPSPPLLCLLCLCFFLLSSIYILQVFLVLC